MKRTFAGIALATMTLGTVVPAAFASTAAASTITYTQVKKTIDANGTTLSQPYAFVASDGSNPTTYMPIWYVGKALEAAGFTQSWNGKVWNLTTSTKTNFSSISVGSGDASIEVNGRVVKKVNTHVAKDPAAGSHAVDTTYMPIFYIDEIFQAAGIDFNWDGNTWIVRNSYKSGIAGFVTDKNGPLKGVTVTAGGKSAVSDVNGYYHIDDLAPGQYTVNFSDLGYSSSSVSNVNVTKDNGSTVGTELTALNKSDITLSSIAVNATTGAPVANADVKVEALNKTTNTWSTVALATTGTDGKFSISNSDSSVNGALAFGGTYRVAVSEDYNKVVSTSTATYKPYDNLQSAFVANQRTITLAADSNDNALSGFQLQPVAATTISGSVKDSSGAESTTATVKLLDQDGKTVLAEQAAISTGYSFSGLTLPSGKYTLLVNDGTNAISTNTINVVAGQNVADNIQLQAGHSVTLKLGTVGLGDTFAAGDYTVQVVDANGVVVNSDTETMASASELDFSPVGQIPDGSYTLVVSGKFVQTTKIPVIVAGSNVTAEGRASTAGVVSGTITAGTGATASGAVAQVELKNASGTIVASGQTDTTGAYEFDGLAPGQYTVTASEDGYTPNSTSALTVAAGTPTTQGTDLTLSALPTTASVSGYVREASSLNPLSGTVTFYPVTEDGTGLASTLPSVSATVTNGKYSATTLAPGAYNAVVASAGHENNVSTLTVAAGDNLANQNYTLVKGGSAVLNVTVKDSQGNAVAPDTISLTDAFGRAESATPSTSQTGTQTMGQTAFANLSGGTYTLNIAKTGDVTVAQTVTLTTGETSNLTITLQAVAQSHQVSIRVLDATDADINGANVVAFDSNGNEVAIATTDATSSGIASMNLQDGAYTLKVFKNGYIVGQQSVTVNGQDVTVPALQLQKY